MTGKYWLASKTFLFNIVAALLAITNELAPLIDQLADLGWDDARVAQARAVVSLVTILGNLVLRAVTNQPVRFR